MRSRSPFVLPAGCLLCLVLAGWAFPPAARAWGPRGHELVNEYAPATLPPELRSFYAAHREWLVANASAPDEWINTDLTEPPHHFMDMEVYAKKFEQMPRTREEAVEMAGKDFVAASGDLLWWLPHATRELARAMRARDQEQILRWSVAVAHYAADICQPLHTTENYDGQLTQQPGLHARFETQTVNQVAGFLKLEPAPARPLADVYNSVFAQVARSYRLLPPILEADKQAKAADPAFGPTYTALMNARLRGLIQGQLAAGATLTGSLWLTAWEEAGRPDLAALPPADK